MAEAPTARSTVFKSNRSQAVRLPKAVAFPPEVEIIQLGRNRLICPVGHRWDDYFLNRPKLPDDFPDEILDLPPDAVEPF